MAGREEAKKIEEIKLEFGEIIEEWIIILVSGGTANLVYGQSL